MDVRIGIDPNSTELPETHAKPRGIPTAFVCIEPLRDTDVIVVELVDEELGKNRDQKTVRVIVHARTTAQHSALSHGLKPELERRAPTHLESSDLCVAHLF